MQLARFYFNKAIRWGIIEAQRVRVIAGEPFAKISATTQTVPLSEIKILPPATPSKIVLVGLNYREHAKELHMKLPKAPIIFLKPPSSLIGHGEAIRYPAAVTRLDYEAELALVIKKKAKNVAMRDAKDYILGYTCLNDVTARDLQKKDIQWTRAKSFDAFCPLGPWIETKLEAVPLKIKLYLNGLLKQHSSTANLIFSVDYLISFISGIMTLLPGDVISTGTPPGVGPMKKGDAVEVEIEKIGTLKNYIR
jgi:2-keto-4-pentenoate hydratase/2-oxohepta-3-ene-1,7-dioic acid hydratase in catechol pathway